MFSPAEGEHFPSTQTHTGLTSLNPCLETNGLCLGTAAGRGANSPFYYSEVHFNLHMRHCVCDGLCGGKHYSPERLARGKNKGDMGRIKNSLLQCRILIRGLECFQNGSRYERGEDQGSARKEHTHQFPLLANPCVACAVIIFQERSWRVGSLTRISHHKPK